MPRYRLTAPLPFSVEFPGSRHDFEVRALGGGALMTGGGPVMVLWVRNYHGPARKFAGDWRAAEAYGEEALHRELVEAGFWVRSGTALETIMERAVRDGLAVRVDGIAMG